MSTNKTKNYRLHAWVPGDTFLLSEINENFERLDAAAHVVFGTYEGDGTDDRVIELGFTPQAVLLENENGQRLCNLNGPRGGLAFPGFPQTYSRAVLEVVEGGFRVSPESGRNGSYGTNDRGVSFRYIAFR